MVRIKRCLTFIAGNDSGCFFSGISRTQLRDFVRVDCSTKNIKQADMFLSDCGVSKVVEVSQPLNGLIVSLIDRVILGAIRRLFARSQSRELAMVYIPEGIATSEVVMTVASKMSGSVVICEMGGKLDIRVGKRAYQVSIA